MKIALLITGGLASLLALVWLGLRMQPKSFAPHGGRTPALKTVPLPAGLPAPVERFCRTVYGEQVPVIETVVIKGRAKMTIGITLPARFVFVHNAGKDYRHYFEATWFPALWVTDPRVHWQAVDDRTALMFVPFGDKQENFVLRFNAETGLLDSMEAMRYRDAGDQAKKILWITRFEQHQAA